MKWVVRDTPKLYRETEQASFLEISPLDPEGAARAKGQLVGREYPRMELAKILQDYNSDIGNDTAAAANIAKLEQAESCCVITGQQLGFMGGPSYTILKAITCLLVAREHNAVPVFWLATEDHDVGEIDHAYLLDSLGNLDKFYLALPKDGRFVEALRLFPNHHEVVAKFLEAVDLPSIPIETSYSRLMIRVLLKLFAGTGLVFVEPYLLRPLARPFFQRELAECDTISKVLRDTTERLGQSTLEVDQGSNLFLKVDGKYRRRILRKGAGFHAGGHEFSLEQLLDLVEEAPERFSTNAAARTVLQSLLFPTLAYVAGPGELAYYHQLKDYHHLHDVSMPWVVPRLSATLVTPEAGDMLHKCHLEPWDEMPHHWSQVIPHLESGVEAMQQEWEQSCAKYFSDELSDEVRERFTRDAVRKLQRKITVARLRREGIPPYALHYLRNLLHPHGKLQERVINWWEFQGRTEENLVEAFLSGVDWRTGGHLYCYT